jgi:hypothetical protein
MRVDGRSVKTLYDITIRKSKKAKEKLKKYGNDTRSVNDTE